MVKSSFAGIFFFLVSEMVFAQSSVPDPRVTVNYHYQPAQPRIVNGQPVLDFKYWACIKDIEVRFSRPVNYTSLLGKFVASGKYRSDRAFVLSEVGPGMDRFVYKAAGSAICAEQFHFETIALKSGVLFEAGARLASETRWRLQFPAPRNHNGGGRVAELTGNGPLVATPSVIMEAAPPDSSCQRLSTGPSKMCLTNLLPTSRITATRLNKAFVTMQAWLRSEKQRPVYFSNSLSLLPFDETILAPRGPGSRARHFGFADVISVVRTAAKFTHLVLPSLREIGLADITTEQGETPHVTWPDGSRNYLHPEGAHQGEDADIGYISTGNGNDQKNPLDIEANFWLLYNVLQSTGTDLVYTAYRAEFIAYAKAALRAGLINDIAAARFSSARVIQDANLKHDTHMHVKVANHDNGRRSLRFTPENDAYNCMLGMRSSGGSEKNFCLGN